MKKVLTLALCLTMFAGSAMADHIGVYGDAAGTKCFGGLPWVGFSQLFVLHRFNTGSTASQFRQEIGLRTQISPTKH